MKNLRELGGAKVGDKIVVIDRFRELADVVLIGGAMCFPFLYVVGHAVGASLCSDEDTELAGRDAGGITGGRRDDRAAAGSRDLGRDCG